MKPLVVLACLLTASVSARADEMRAVSPLEGYACVNLSLPSHKMRWDELPQAKAEPSAAAPVAGVVQATVLARYPLVVRNGYAEIILYTGQKAWIQQSLLAARNPRCRAVLMSDGKPGIAGI